jgi:hypothetical protein
VAFSSIPATYKDLLLKYYVRSSGGGVDQLRMRVNGDTGNNYDYSASALVGATPSGTSLSAQSSFDMGVISGLGSGANSFGAGEIAIARYASRSYYLTVYGHGGAYYTGTNTYVSLRGGQWRSSAVVNAILLWANGGNIVAGSKFALYGIR